MQPNARAATLRQALVEKLTLNIRIWRRKLSGKVITERFPRPCEHLKLKHPGGQEPMKMVNMLLTRFFLASAALIGGIGIAIAQAPTPSSVPTPAPEPASLALLAVGVGGTIIARKLFHRPTKR
jgi:hypothetical protein